MLIEDDITKMIDQLKRHEGYRRKPYRDTVGILTVGYGCNLLSRGIYENEATYMLSCDIERLVDRLEKLPYWQNLTPARKSVLINMAFNMGYSSLMKFKNTLRFVAEGNYTNAAKNMMKSKWAKQVKGRAVELSNQMRTGKFKK